MTEQPQANKGSFLDKQMTRREFLSWVLTVPALYIVSLLAQGSWQFWTRDMFERKIDTLQRTIRDINKQLQSFSSYEQGYNLSLYNQLQEEFQTLVGDFYEVAKAAREKKDLRESLPGLVERSEALAKKVLELRKYKGIDG